MTLTTKSQNINSAFVLFLFWSTLFFQITAFRNIWNLESLSRFINFSILISSTMYFLFFLMYKKVNLQHLTFYMLPGFLLFLGYFINLIFSIYLNPSSISSAGELIAPAIFLCVPGFVYNGNINAKQLWNYYYMFMALLACLCLAEYWFVSLNLITTSPIVISEGIFEKGLTSLYYPTVSGEIHYRLYGSFYEPGSFAMWLIPAIVYAIVMRKYLIIPLFLYALYLTDSLGGFLSVLLILPLIIASIAHKRGFLEKIIFLFFGVIFLAFCIFISFDMLQESYQHRGNSAVVRELGANNFFDNLGFLIVNYPFGMVRSDTTVMAKIPLYELNTFAPAQVFYRGGILSFIGYLFMLTLSLLIPVFTLFRNNVIPEDKVVSISILVLFPFIFQRSEIWDTALFSFLIAPYYLKFISGINYNYI